MIVLMIPKTTAAKMIYITFNWNIKSQTKAAIKIIPDKILFSFAALMPKSHAASNITAATAACIPFRTTATHILFTNTA